MSEALFISKSVFGRDLVYPGNQVANLFAALVGSKTFTGADLANIRALGYSTRVVGYVPPRLAFNPDDYPAGFVI